MVTEGVGGDRGCRVVTEGAGGDRGCGVVTGCVGW